MIDSSKVITNNRNKNILENNLTLFFPLQVVKALIIMLHRQWVKVRRSESNLSAYKERIVQFLRDTVLLLHSLSQKDKLFHEHCLEVLHQYDEAVPGVRAILKKTPNLNASEGKVMAESKCSFKNQMHKSHSHYHTILKSNFLWGLFAS